MCGEASYWGKRLTLDECGRYGRLKKKNDDDDDDDIIKTYLV